jgi:hypothetical protein
MGTPGRDPDLFLQIALDCPDSPRRHNEEDDRYNSPEENAEVASSTPSAPRPSPVRGGHGNLESASRDSESERSKKQPVPTRDIEHERNKENQSVGFGKNQPIRHVKVSNVAVRSLLRAAILAVAPWPTKRRVFLSGEHRGPADSLDHFAPA